MPSEAALALVIVVEDDPATRELIDIVLSAAGHETCVAANAAEALELLRGDQRFDVLFTDIELGRNDPTGIEIAQEARQMRQDLRVIYTTGGLATHRMKAQFVEGSSFLQKPYRADQLLKALDLLLMKEDDLEA